MTAEQVVRDFLNAFETGGVDLATPYLDDNMTLNVVGPPPLVGGKMEFVGQGTLMKTAMPDWKWGVQSMATMGDEVAVELRWSGTHTGTLQLSAFVPGAPDIPPTGKKVSVPDHFVFTVMGDKVTGLLIDSPQGGGLPELLNQLGVQLPG